MSPRRTSPSPGGTRRARAHPMPVRPPRQGPSDQGCPQAQSGLRADRCGVRQHCAQCLTEVYATAAQASPTGETLCGPCHSALWGPKATDEFRVMVELHSGR